MNIHKDIKTEAAARWGTPSHGWQGLDMRAAFEKGARYALGHIDAPVPARVALVAQMAADYHRDLLHDFATQTVQSDDDLAALLPMSVNMARAIIHEAETACAEDPE